MPEADTVNIYSLSDLATPWCVHVIATLRIADHIHSGITQIDELAAAASANAAMLHRVMTHLVQKGVFDERSDGQFTLNEPAEAFLDESIRLGLDLDLIGGRMAGAWSGLLSQVRTGNPVYHEIFGLPFWKDLDAHPEIGASFDDLMGPAGHGTPDSEVLVNADWATVRTVVDVGGGSGAMLAAILQVHPHVSGTLVDLPRTANSARERFESARVAGRVHFSGQSFFDPLPSGADLYLVHKVLNDWPDEEALTILRRCAEAVSSSGRVVVVGSVSSNSSGAGLSIETVLVGGKNRSLSEFQELAHQAGLEIHITGSQPTGRFIVECRPTR